MAIAPLRVSEMSARNLALIRDQSADRLSEVLAELLAAKMPIVSLRALRATFERALDKETARELTRQLIALGTYIRHSGSIPAEAVAGLTLGLKARGWSEAELNRWTAIAPQLEGLLSTNHIAILSKAMDISSDFEHIYDDARILTDIRPIFNETKSEIVSAIICQRLRLAYRDGTKEPIVLSIAMDRNDVEELKRACEEALEKMSIAGGLVKKAGLETFNGEEESDEFR
jgi:hypothetical protein